MCSHLQFQGRQVKDLPALRVGLAGHLLQRRAWMARLASGLSARGLTQRARLLGKTVTRRWRATVATIGGQLVFQLFDP
jgi:hypothetical protein